jgi:DNA-binding MarR family transcriptional regulator
MTRRKAPTTSCAARGRTNRAVGQLTDLGFVERLESGDDRREIMLQLTPRGREVYEELLPLLLARERTLLSCLSPAQAGALDEIMLTLERSLDLVVHKK